MSRPNANAHHGHDHHGDAPTGIVRNEAFWDQMYQSSSTLWSGQANPQLVSEAVDLAPGGSLLVVGHHPSDLTTTVARPPVPELFFTASDVALSLAPEDWVVVVDESPDSANRPPASPRYPYAAKGSVLGSCIGYDWPARAGAAVIRCPDDHRYEGRCPR